MSTTPSPQLPLPPPLVTDPFVPGWQLNHPPPAATNVPQHSESIQPPGTASPTSNTNTNTAHLSAIDALSQTFSRLSLADSIDVTAHTAPPPSSPPDKLVPAPSPPHAPSPLALDPARTRLPLLLTPTRPPPGFPAFVSPAERLARLRAAQRLLRPHLSSPSNRDSPSNPPSQSPPTSQSRQRKSKALPPATTTTATAATAVPSLSPVRSIWREVDEVLDGCRCKGGYEGGWYGASHPVRREGRRGCWVLVGREEMERRRRGRGEEGEGR